MVNLTIDDREYSVDSGLTVLEVAREKDIKIPALCYHPSLKPSGSCRLCAVEVLGGPSDRKVIMLACVLKVKDKMRIKTTGYVVQQARTKAFRRLLQMAPEAKSIVALAKAYGIDPGPPADGCIRCRLCIRVCKEIVGPGALKMEKRDGLSLVVPIAGRCIGCGTCANICPTKVIRVEDTDTSRTISIRDDIIGQHPLEKCQGCGRLYATPKFLEHIHRRTASHPDVKSHHNYCPTCAKLFSDRIQSLG